MAKSKTLEASKILKALESEKLQGMKSIYDDKKVFVPFVKLINQLIVNEKDKIVGLASDIQTVDDAVSKATKQNFYRGRVSSFVLIHSLLVNAGGELEKREASNK